METPDVTARDLLSEEARIVVVAALLEYASDEPRRLAAVAAFHELGMPGAALVLHRFGPADELQSRAAQVAEADRAEDANAGRSA